MPHNNPLHRSVGCECLCCGITYEFTFTSVSDQVMCALCKRHYGRAAIREKDHKSQWQAKVAETDEQITAWEANFRGQIREKDAEIAAALAVAELLRDSLRTQFIGVQSENVRQWLRTEEVVKAETARDAAFRSRDSAFRALWHIDRLHHESKDRPHMCICGKAAAGCGVLEAVGEVGRALYSWETNQIERAESGWPHGLPREHPKYVSVY